MVSVLCDSCHAVLQHQGGCDVYFCDRDCYWRWMSKRKADEDAIVAAAKDSMRLAGVDFTDLRPHASTVQDVSGQVFHSED